MLGLVASAGPNWSGSTVTTPPFRRIASTEEDLGRLPPEPRIVRQEGCFLMVVFRRHVLRGSVDSKPMTAEQVRNCMSMPFRLIKYDQAVAAAEGRNLVGKPPKARAFTLRVRAKQVLKQQLEQGFGYSHDSLFPDFPGFADYGRSFKAARVARRSRLPSGKERRGVCSRSAGFERSRCRRRQRTLYPFCTHPT